LVWQRGDLDVRLALRARNLGGVRYRDPLAQDPFVAQREGRSFELMLTIAP